jgi:hypothetical protein
MYLCVIHSHTHTHSHSPTHQAMVNHLTGAHTGSLRTYVHTHTSTYIHTYITYIHTQIQRGVNNETFEIIPYFYKINRLRSVVTGQYIYIYITVQLPLY